jgi:hypothetical protein
MSPYLTSQKRTATGRQRRRPRGDPRENPRTVSIQKRGSSYVVRWREGGRQLSRSFARRGDAVAFETDVRRRRQLGALAPG